MRETEVESSLMWMKHSAIRCIIHHARYIFSIEQLAQCVVLVEHFLHFYDIMRATLQMIVWDGTKLRGTLDYCIVDIEDYAFFVSSTLFSNLRDSSISSCFTASRCFSSFRIASK